MTKATRNEVLMLLRHIDQDLVATQENLQQYPSVQAMIDLAISTLTIDRERIQAIMAKINPERAD